MYGVVIAPTGKAFAVGMSSSTNRPTVYTSLRASNFSSWTSVGSTALTSAPAGSRLNGISTYNGVNLLAVGMKLALFTSADSGDSWSAVSIASLCTDTNTGLYSVSYKSANYAYVGGTNGCMVRFDGTFWSSVTSPFITGTSSFIFHSIAIATPSISFAVDSTNGQILRTVNGGVTWSRDVKTGSGVSLYSIGIYDYSIAVAGGDLSMGSVYVRSQEPTSQPSTQPSSNPSAQPVSSPTSQPSTQPSSNPTMFPFSHPSGQPSVSPSCQPSSQPSALPSLQPFSLPTTQPSDRPSSQPSSQPSDQPSTQPSGVPSAQPTMQPSVRPSSQPSAIPTMQPSERPSCQPTAQPSVSPSSQPSGYPTGQPTWHPTISKPTSEPTGRLLDGNWTAVNRVFNETTYQFFDVKCADTIHCVMVGYNYEITNSRYVGVIARTAQGGVRRSAWRIALSLPYLTFQALSYREMPQPCFITVDQRGGIYTSTDNGVTWINSFNLTGAAGHSTNFSEKIANSLSHGDQGYAFVVGQNTLYRNVQSGIYSDWATVRTLGAQNLLDVSTHDGRVSIVVGEGGVVYRCSYNGFMVGDCALIDHQLTSTDLYNVVFCQYGSAMALGVDGSVLRSANEGYEWTMLKIKVAPWPYSVFGHNLVVLTNSVGYIVDVTGHLITTINGGRRWENETFIAAEVQLPVFCLTFYSTSVAIMGDSRGGVYVKRPIPTSAPSSHPSSQPSSQPSRQPVMRPSGQPSRQPTNQPTGQPSRRPSSQPTRQPQSRPSAQPSKMPTSQPSRQPSSHPSDQPSSQPSLQPSAQPSFQPSALPTSQPSACPSMQPSSQPIGNPSSQPSSRPTFSPSKIPSCQPTGQPSRRPSSQPSKAPTTQPSSRPSNQPSKQPTSQPSQQPSSQPTRQPISRPSSQPSRRPTSQPSTQPTRQPTGQPSKAPTAQPSSQPSRKPSTQPTKCPTTQPTGQPSRQPSSRPSSQPTRQPTGQPSRQPSSQPTGQPSRQPSSRPSSQPTVQPSNQPSNQPSAWPTGQPSEQPTTIPTMQPSAQPTLQPSAQPTTIPSAQPSTQPSKNPTAQPSSIPTRQPSTCPSSQPSCQPSGQPTGQPSRQPSSQPTRQPTAQPSGIPSAQPSCQPSNCPSMQPTTIPSNQPSSQPTTQPTVVPTMQPSRQPTTQPTGQPSRKPSSQPSGQPSRQPTSQPSRQPTSQPSFQPSNQPSSQPSVQPTTQPTGQPSRQPSSQPSGQPTTQPTFQPSSQPSSQPTAQPSRQPTSQPSRQPTTQPTAQPTNQPTTIPSRQPTIQPSQQPTTSPTTQPSNNPTGQPSRQPTSQPLSVPSSQPSTQPSSQPSKSPTTQPTAQPSRQPTSQPSGQPSTQPSSQPSVQPTTQPTGQPSRQPSSQPSGQPTRQPSAQPSSQPSIQPSLQPTGQPTTIPTTQPSIQPTSQPSIQPTTIPTMQPSTQPTGQPTTIPTTQPTSQPSRQPSAQPSRQPTTQPTGQPSRQPSSQPSRQPTTQPSGQPSRQPSNQPTGTPTRQPSSQPSKSPTTQPSAQPSRQPSAQPSIQPSAQPSMQPSTQPSSQPSSSPSCQPSSQPSGQPSAQPSSIPSRQPSGQPSAQPLSQPSAQPSRQPSSRPSSQPSRVPTTRPTGQPSRTPTSQPSQQPSVQPTAQPSCRPSGQPTGQPINRPSSQPSVQPSTQPSGQPSRNPSSQPSSQPTRQPTGQPISSPTSAPSTQPTGSPSRQPTSVPTMRPSGQPSEQPSTQPSVQPSTQPTSSPSTQPSVQPSSQPTSRPSAQPSRQPSDQPTTQPSTQPSVQPSFQPTGQPTTHPTSQPISAPSTQPTGQPSRAPSSQPSMQPSSQPSRSPSSQPTIQPTGQPSRSPSSQPSHQPTAQPTSVPSTAYPTSLPSSQPSTSPSAQPSVSPSLATLFAFAFNVTQGIQGTSRARFLADSSAATTAITMTVTDLVPSITHTNVRIVWVRDSPDVFSRRLEGVALHEPEYSQFGTMAVGTAGVNVLYTITYVPTSRDNHDQNVEYSRIVSALTSGVQSGRFNSTLHSNAVVYNAVSLLNSAVPPTALLNISERLVAVFIRSPMPTSQPSSQPSAQPASHPSSLPSSQPIGEPTGQPTCKPSSEPTARPTITLGTRYTMLLEALIKRYTPSEAHLRNVFYDVVARNAQVFDTCTLWSAFLDDNVHYSASIGSKRVTAVQLLQQEQHLLPTVVRCEVPELAMDIAGELATRQGAQLRSKNSIYCDGHEWTVNSCAGSSPAANSAAICVDCVDPCSALFCAPYSNSSLPPNVNANFSTGYVTLSPCVGETYDYAQCPVQDGLSRILSFELASQEGGVYSVFYSLLTLFVVVLLVVMGYERRVYSTQRKVKDHRTGKSDGALTSLDVPAREGGDGAATQISVDLLSLSAIYPPSTPVRPSNQIDRRLERPAASSSVYNGANPSLQSDNVKPSTAMLSHLQSILRFTYFSPRIETTAGSSAPLALASSASVSIRERIMTGIYPFHYLATAYQSSLATSRSLRLKYHMLAFHRVIWVLFFMSVFFNAQFIADDGTCAAFNSPSECHGPRTIFSRSVRQCEWIGSSGEDVLTLTTADSSSQLFVPQCVWSNYAITMDIFFRLLLVTALIASVSRHCLQNDFIEQLLFHSAASAYCSNVLLVVLQKGIVRHRLLCLRAKFRAALRYARRTVYWVCTPFRKAPAESAEEEEDDYWASSPPLTSQSIVLGKDEGSATVHPLDSILVRPLSAEPATIVVGGQVVGADDAEEAGSVKSSKSNRPRSAAAAAEGEDLMAAPESGSVKSNRPQSAVSQKSNRPMSAASSKSNRPRSAVSFDEAQAPRSSSAKSNRPRTALAVEQNTVSESVAIQIGSESSLLLNDFKTHLFSHRATAMPNERDCVHFDEQWGLNQAEGRLFGVASANDEVEVRSSSRLCGSCCGRGASLDPEILVADELVCVCSESNQMNQCLVSWADRRKSFVERKRKRKHSTLEPLEDSIGKSVFLLFLLDQVGRDSYCAMSLQRMLYDAVFFQAQPPTTTLLTKAYLLGLLLLDAVLMFYCIQYTKEKPLVLLYTWLVLAILAVLVDSVLIEGAELLWCKVVTPFVIDAEVSTAVDLLISLIGAYQATADSNAKDSLAPHPSRRMRTQALDVFSDRPFSVSHYFALSDLVARKYHTLPHSAVVASLRDPLPPAYLSRMCGYDKAAIAAANATHEEEDSTAYALVMNSGRWAANWVKRASHNAVLWMSARLPTELQRLLVSGCTLFLVFVLYCIAKEAIHSEATGAVSVVLVGGVIVLLALWIARNLCPTRTNASRVSEAPPETTSNLLEDPQSVDATNNHGDAAVLSVQHPHHSHAAEQEEYGLSDSDCEANSADSDDDDSSAGSEHSGDEDGLGEIPARSQQYNNLHSSKLHSARLGSGGGSSRDREEEEEKSVYEDSSVLSASDHV